MAIYVSQATYNAGTDAQRATWTVDPTINSPGGTPQQTVPASQVPAASYSPPQSTPTTQSSNLTTEQKQQILFQMGLAYGNPDAPEYQALYAKAAPSSPVAQAQNVAQQAAQYSPSPLKPVTFAPTSGSLTYIGEKAPSPVHTFEVQGAPVFGGMSSVSGYEVNFVAPAPLMSVEPSKSPYGYQAYQAPTVGKAEAQLFSPVAQYTVYTGEKNVAYEIDKTQAAQLMAEQTALSAPGVVGGVRLPSGEGIIFSQVPPTVEPQRTSIFNTGESVNQGGNKAFRDTMSGLAGYGAERITELATLAYPAMKYVPTSVTLPFIGELSPKTIAAGATSGALLISPFGQGEAVSTGTYGTSTQKLELGVEVAEMMAFGAVGGKVFGSDAKVQPARTVQTTGLLGDIKVASQVTDTAQTFRVNANEVSGYKIQSTTTAKLSDQITISGKPRESVSLGEARLVTAQTPLSTLKGNFLVTESMKETTILGDTRVTAGREAIPVFENVPQRALGSSDVTLFQRIPSSGVFTPSYITRMATKNTPSGVEVSISQGGKQIGGLLTSEKGQIGFGLTQKGQQIFAFDELGRVMGTSEVPIQIRQEPTINFKPEAKQLPKGNLLTGFTVSETLPAKTTAKLPIEATIKLESGGEAFLPGYKPPEAPYKMSDIMPTKGGQKQLQYNPAEYDKPISMSDISTALESTRIKMKPANIVPTGTGGGSINLAKFTTEVKSQNENQFGRYAVPRVSGMTTTSSYAQYAPQKLEASQFMAATVSQASAQLVKQVTITKQGEAQLTRQTTQLRQSDLQNGGQLTSQFTSQTTTQKEITRQFTGTTSTTSQLTGLTQITGQGLRQLETQAQPQITIGKTDFNTKPPEVPGIGIPQIEIPTKPKIPGGLGGLFPSGDGNDLSGMRRKRQKGRYQPSFIARELGIKTTKSIGLKAEKTGFSIRGLIGSSKKR